MAAPSSRSANQPLVVIGLAMAGGIALERLVLLPLIVWLLVAVATWAAWLVCFNTKQDRAGALFLLFSVAALAGTWGHDRWRRYSPHEIARFARELDQPSVLRAAIVTGPRRMPVQSFDPLRSLPPTTKTRVLLDVTAVRSGTEYLPATGRAALIIDQPLEHLHAGDNVVVYCRLARLRPALNPGEFDYAWHARGDRRLVTCHAKSAECVVVEQPGSAWNVQRWFDDARLFGDQVLWNHLNPEQASLASAVLLGLREEVDNDRNDAFLKTGTIHILSISGVHVGLLAWILFKGLRWGLLGRRAALLTVAGVTAAYTWLTDAEPPAVRAAILVFIVCWSLYRGRTGLAFNSLAAAAIVVMILNPADVFRPGPQLSFLSAACLAWISLHWRDWHRQDALQRLIAETRPWPEKAWANVRDFVRSGLLISGIIWCVTIPLVMARFNICSPIALVLNIVLEIPVTLAMIAGFGILCLGWWLPPLAAVCGWLAEAAFHLLDWVVVNAPRVPGSHFWTAGPSDWWLAGFYGGLLWWALGERWRPPTRWSIALLLSWCALGVTVSDLRRAEQADHLDCAFVSVGHGLATVINLPNGQTFVYDVGAMGAPSNATRAVSAVLWERGVSRLDGVFLSHADTDHYNGLPGLLDRFGCQRVFVSDAMFVKKNSAMVALQSALLAQNLEQVFVAKDQVLNCGDCRLAILQPPRGGYVADSNANSVVLAIEYQGHRILLTGDLDQAGMLELISRPPLRCDVISAPHHGSPYSKPQDFLHWCRAPAVVISGSLQEDSLPSRRIYADLGVESYHTARQGAVTVRIQNGKLSILPYRQPPPE